MAKDKFKLFCSPLGMYSMLRKPYIISVCNDRGQLNYEKLKFTLDNIKKMGANALRDFQWYHNIKSKEMLAPFKMREHEIVFNNTFFINQKIIKDECAKRNIEYWPCLFNESQIRGPWGKYSPWAHFGDSYFYSKDAKNYRYKYMDRWFKIHNKFDQCNEIRITNSQLNTKIGTEKVLFLIDTFVYMIKSGINPRNIILSVDYLRKEEKIDGSGMLYKRFREGVVRELGKSWEFKLKTECISPIHNCIPKNIKALFGHDTPDEPDDDASAGGTRRMLFSTDGWRHPRPSENQVKDVFNYILRTKHKSAGRDKIHLEVVYGKEDSESLTSCIGMSRAYKDRMGHWPVNYESGGGSVPPQIPSKRELLNMIKSLTNRVEILEREK